MNSTIMPAQQSLEISQNPLLGLFMTAVLSVGELLLEFDVTAASKVRTRVHEADLIASW